MRKSSSSTPSPSPAESPQEGVSNEKALTPLKERSHVFEHRHWVNEACGDDLWET